MQKGLLPVLLISLTTIVLALQGCKKESALGIDNDKVVKTPYSLYAATEEGWVINSNDGENYKSVFPPDGYPPVSIATAGNNLLILKKNLHVSENNGRNFNPAYDNVRIFPWQSMLYNSRSHNKTYVASNDRRGIAVSHDNGKTWLPDTMWQDNVPPNLAVSSFAGLSNGSLYCYSNINNSTFRKAHAEDLWTPVTVEGFFPVLGSEYFLSSSGNTLYLTDYNGEGGVWYSEDEGANFTKFQQGALPKFVTYTCGESPYGGKTFIVGTLNGLYRVDTSGSFVTATVGLEIGTEVYAMTVKRNIYKNDVTKTYVFIGTNNGIYRSEDGGESWDKMTFDQLERKYVVIR